MATARWLWSSRIDRRSIGCTDRVIRAATSLTLAALIVKFASTLKEFAVAGAYGRSIELDAFLFALLIPNLLINLIAEPLNQVLLPTLIQTKLDYGQLRAQQLLSTSLAWMCILLLLATLLTGLAARATVALSSVVHAKEMLSVHLLFSLLPMILLGGIASYCTAVLNSVGRFTVPSLIQLVVPICSATGVLILHGRLGIWAIVGTTIFGFTIQAIILVWLMDRHAYRFRLPGSLRNADLSRVARQYLPAMLSSVVASGGLIADQGFAMLLSMGSLSALVFAGRYVGLILTALAGSVSSALAPHFSLLVAEHDWSECRRTLRKWSLLTAAISIPLSISLIIGANFLVRITLQHGAFGPRDTAVVATVLRMFAIQIPFFAVSRVYYRFVLAMQRSDLILYCGVANLLLDIVLDLVLMRSLGVAGIALSTSVWCITTLVFLWCCARKLLRDAGFPISQLTGRLLQSQHELIP